MYGVLAAEFDDLVDRLHSEIPGHEFDDRPHPGHGRADAQSGESLLGDQRVDDPLRPELVEQTLADLVGAPILRDLLADQHHFPISAHLLGQGVAQRLAHRHLRSQTCVFHLGRRRRRHRFFGAVVAARRAAASAAPCRPSAARPPAASKALASSPSASSSTIGVLTATASVPSGTRMRRGYPRRRPRPPSSSCRSRSPRSRRPRKILSPSFFAHLASCPRSLSATARHQNLHRHPFPPVAAIGGSLLPGFDQDIGPQFGRIGLRARLSEFRGFVDDVFDFPIRCP